MEAFYAQYVAAVNALYDGVDQTRRHEADRWLTSWRDSSDTAAVVNLCFRALQEDASSPAIQLLAAQTLHYRSRKRIAGAVEPPCSAPERLDPLLDSFRHYCHPAAPRGVRLQLALALTALLLRGLHENSAELDNPDGSSERMADQGALNGMLAHLGALFAGGGDAESSQRDAIALGTLLLVLPDQMRSKDVSLNRRSRYALLLEASSASTGETAMQILHGILAHPEVQQLRELQNLLVQALTPWVATGAVKAHVLGQSPLFRVAFVALSDVRFSSAAADCLFEIAEAADSSYLYDVRSNDGDEDSFAIATAEAAREVALRDQELRVKQKGSGPSRREKKKHRLPSAPPREKAPQEEKLVLCAAVLEQLPQLEEGLKQLSAQGSPLHNPDVGVFNHDAMEDILVRYCSVTGRLCISLFSTFLGDQRSWPRLEEVLKVLMHTSTVAAAAPVFTSAAGATFHSWERFDRIHDAIRAQGFPVEMLEGAYDSLVQLLVEVTTYLYSPQHLDWSNRDSDFWTADRRDAFAVFRRDARELIRKITRRNGEASQLTFIDGACRSVMDSLRVPDAAKAYVFGDDQCSEVRVRLPEGLQAISSRPDMPRDEDRIAGICYAYSIGHVFGDDAQLWRSEALLHALSAVCSRAGALQSQPGALQLLGSLFKAFGVYAETKYLHVSILCGATVLVGAVAPQLVVVASVAVLDSCLRLIEESLEYPEKEKDAEHTPELWPMRTKRDATEHAGTVALLKVTTAMAGSRRLRTLRELPAFVWVKRLGDIVARAEAQRLKGYMSEKSYALCVQSLVLGCQDLPAQDATELLQPLALEQSRKGLQFLDCTRADHDRLSSALSGLRRLSVLFQAVSEAAERETSVWEYSPLIRILPDVWNHLSLLLETRVGATPVAHALEIVLKSTAGSLGPRILEFPEISDAVFTTMETALASDVVQASWWSKEAPEELGPPASFRAARAQVEAAMGEFMVRSLFEDDESKARVRCNAAARSPAECYLGLGLGLVAVWTRSGLATEFVSQLGSRFAPLVRACARQVRDMSEQARTMDALDPGVAAAACALMSTTCARYVYAADRNQLRECYEDVLVSLCLGSGERLTSSAALRFFRFMYQHFPSTTTEVFELFDERTPMLLGVLLQCANDRMPSYMLDDIVLTMGTILSCFGPERLERWMGIALQDPLVPRPNLAVHAKQTFMEQFCAASHSYAENKETASAVGAIFVSDNVKSYVRIKKVVKGFCGGKRVGDLRSQQPHAHNARPEFFEDGL